MSCPALVNACLNNPSNRDKNIEFWNSMLNDPTCDPNIFSESMTKRSEKLLSKSRLGRWLYWDEIKELRRMSTDSMENAINGNTK